MSFTITYGSPGVLTAVLIVFGVAVVAIVGYFLLAVVKSAHDDLVEHHERQD